MINKPKILVVCGRNNKRSRTAEFIFKNDDRIFIRSVGLSPNSNRKISENDLFWTDYIFVMETEQKSKIVELYGYIDLPKIEVLDIPDEYDFMDEELMDILTVKLNETFKNIFQI